MRRNASFSLAVQGSGALLGMFVTEAQTHFRNATIYDQSDRTNTARQGEAGLRRPGGGPPITLARPGATDVTVTFATVGASEQVTIQARGQRRQLQQPLAGQPMQAANRFVRQVLRTVGQLV